MAIFRDTRSVLLKDDERFNYFPASPLYTVTCVFEGELRKTKIGYDVEAARNAPLFPRLFVMPPQTEPTSSWSEGPVCALTLAFYPDTWSILHEHRDNRNGPCPEPLTSCLEGFSIHSCPEAEWDRLCKRLKNSLNGAETELPGGSGTGRLSDWSRYILTKIAFSSAGRSARTVERRLKQLTGSSRRDLDQFIKIERLHRHVVANPNAVPSAVALDAGYSDQSHMGRAVRRTTGFSPVKLNKLIETAEPFWCYRLLGERF